MKQIDMAKDVCDFLLSLPEIKSCILCGSLSNGNSDEYSDIDIEIDVSGIDNSKYITKIPELFKQKYPVVFTDYAPSLAPEIYVVSIAISNENPFAIVDIKCIATPHIQTMQKEDIASLNNLVDHTLKVFIINLKHYIRGTDCFNDINRMYKRLFNTNNISNEYAMLQEVFKWLKENISKKHINFLNSFKKYF